MPRGVQWEFRLFATLVPAGEADASEVAEMRARQAERKAQAAAAPPKKPWWKLR
jgi:hypothetical protein